MTKLLCCFVLSAVALFGDVTGKWSGTGNGATPDGDHSMSLSLELKQTGSDVTGTVGSSESGDSFSIAGGTIKDNVLTFQVSTDNGTYDVNLKVDGDKMSGEASTKAGDHKFTLKIELKRDS